MSTERDTHFKAFAELLWVEILQSPDFGDVVGYRHFTREQADAIEMLIARRAYDLVLHTANCMDIAWLDRLDMEEIPVRIPDMIAFTEVQS